MLSFRIWDKIDKKMIYPTDKDVLEVYNNGSWAFRQNVYVSSCSFYADAEDVVIFSEDGVLMWGTGEGDIDGDEIYEGDIIKSIDSKKICIVKIPNTYWECKGAVKIIGNIYENPELLGGEK